MDSSYPIDIGGIPDRLVPVIGMICAVSLDVARIIARGPLGSETALDAAMGRNADGDTQKALDILADEAFMDRLRGSGVRWYASEERADVQMIDDDGDLALAIDPLDGSSNIGVNISVGTIFSLYEAKDGANASFLRPAHEQIAAGYIIYGPQTTLTLTTGDGVRHYILDPAAQHFTALDAPVTIPDQASEFAINSSNYRHWPQPIRAYMDDCLLGEKGRFNKNFTMRWVASLVADTQRIITRGGIYLYPGDARPGYESGRLRMLYECAPIALLIEQAGGKATSGRARLLDQSAATIHGRSALVFGSRAEVERVMALFDRHELFGE